MKRRAANGVGCMISASLITFAFYAEYGLGLDPCPLCVFQRMIMIAIGLVFLLSFLHHSAALGRYIYGGVLGILGLSGVAVSGRHVWLQYLPADQVPECGPGLTYLFDVFPLMEALGLVFTGSGECAAVSWSFVGLSMPTWVLIWFFGVMFLGVVNNFRKT